MEPYCDCLNKSRSDGWSLEKSGYWIHVKCGRPSRAYMDICDVCDKVYKPEYSGAVEGYCQECLGV